MSPSPHDEHGESPTGPDGGQQAIVRWLADPAAHGGRAVDHVETHISHVFLVGDRAYKLKKRVRTNFLDFTTLARREAACRREIEVNRSVAASLYLDVIPITRSGDAFELGGRGEPVDWVVEMRRFDRANEFDRLAERGELTVPLVEALADTVARMHCEAPALPQFGGAARVRATVAQIAEAIAMAPGGAQPGEQVRSWRETAGATVDRLSSTLDARRRHGRVRRCHGDLHLGNICLVDGRPTPFDALEFNEEMASTDVLYDVAFTVMDLAICGLGQQANAYLGRYLAATRDYSGVALLPLFVSMRAAVRALVAASRDAPDPHQPDATTYLDLAVGVLAARAPPSLIAVGGLSGSGKSTVARRVAPVVGPAPGALVLRSDVARKHFFGVPPEEALPPDAYAQGISAQVYRLLLRDAGRALRAGAPVILDATFLAPAERDHARALADRLGVTFAGLWLDCPPQELGRRISARTGDASDADLDVLAAQLSRDPGAGEWTPVDAAGTPDETVANALAALAGRIASGMRARPAGRGR